MNIFLEMEILEEGLFSKKNKRPSRINSEFSNLKQKLEKVNCMSHKEFIESVKDFGDEESTRDILDSCLGQPDSPFRVYYNACLCIDFFKRVINDKDLSEENKKLCKQCEKTATERYKNIFDCIVKIQMFIRNNYKQDQEALTILKKYMDSLHDDRERAKETVNKILKY